MGGICSRSDLQDHEAPGVRASQPMAGHGEKSQDASNRARDATAAKRLVDAHEANILSLDPKAGIDSWHTANDSPDKQSAFSDAKEYFASRDRLLALEKTLDFDYQCRIEATPLESRVDEIIRYLRRRDAEEVYSRAETTTDELGQQHPRFAGDHFLSNVDLISKTRLFKVAKQMPKGSHLHIHFNSCLLPNVLLDIAKGMDRMFITSTLPLVSRDNLQNTEIQFSMLRPGKDTPGDMFRASHQTGQTMLFRDFLDQFPKHFDGQSPDSWLQNKIVFSEAEAHNHLQTAAGYVHFHQT